MKIAILVSILTVCAGVKPPPNFHKCNRKNPDFDDCLLKAARHGILQLTRPYGELNIPSAEPFKLTEASIDGGKGPVAVSQNFKNCNLYGMTKMQLETFRFDFDKKLLRCDGTFPEIRKACDYEVKGKVLIIPVRGFGNSTIILKNLKVNATFYYEETKRKGKTYASFTSGDFAMDPESVSFDFLNHEDKRLSDHLNPVLNENWKEIFDDVKGDYSEIVKRIVLKLINGVYGKMSLEESFDD